MRGASLPMTVGFAVVLAVPTLGQFVHPCGSPGDRICPTGMACNGQEPVKPSVQAWCQTWDSLCWEHRGWNGETPIGTKECCDRSVSKEVRDKWNCEQMAN